MILSKESTRWFLSTCCFDFYGAGDVASAGIMAAAQIAAAESAAGATKEAARLNSEAQKAVNAANLLNSKEARGLGGLPTQLPLYTGTFESGTMYPKATSLWEMATGSPRMQVQKNASIADQFRAALGGANKTATGLFTGARTNQQLAEQQPVAQARMVEAGTKRQAINSDLQQRLSELEASNANKGYVGGSTFDRSAAMRTALPFYQDAASAEAAAKMQNALDEQSIKNQNWQLAFQNLNLPSQMAMQNMQYETLPQQAAIQNYTNAYNVFSPFRLDQWTPPTATAWTGNTPVQTTLGNVANTVGNVASSYSQNQAAQKQADALAEQTRQNQEFQREMLAMAMGQQYTPASNSDLEQYAYDQYGWDMP